MCRGGQVADVRLLRDDRGLEHRHGRSAGEGRGPMTPAGCSAATTRRSSSSRPARAGCPTGRCSPRGWRRRPGTRGSRCPTAPRRRSSGPGRTCRSSRTCGPALTALREQGWRLAILTNCDDDLFATTQGAPAGAVRPGGDGGAGAQLQAGPRALPEVRRPRPTSPRRTGSTWPTAGCTTCCPRPGWACARSGLTGTAPGIRPSWPSAASPACAGCRRRSPTSAPSCRAELRG